MNRYTLQFKPRVEKDLRALPREERERVLSAVERLCRGLRGDVKRLTDFTPEFCLRVGDYRILFEIVENTYLTRNGKPEFAVLPIDEFERLKIYLEDLEDLLALRQAKEEEADSPTMSIDELRQRLDGSTA